MCSHEHIIGRIHGAIVAATVAAAIAPSVKCINVAFIHFTLGAI